MSSYLLQQGSGYLLIHEEGWLVDITPNDEFAIALTDLANPLDYESDTVSTWLIECSSSKEKFYSMLDSGSLVASWNQYGLEHINTLRFNSYCQYMGKSPKRFNLIGVSEFAKLLGTTMNNLNIKRRRSIDAIANRKHGTSEIMFPLPLLLVVLTSGRLNK